MFIMTLFQRVLNDLYRARLSCGLMARLHAHPLPTPVSKLDRRHTGRLRKRGTLMTGERRGRGGRGAKLYESKKAWPHKVLTYVEYKAVSGVFQNIDSTPSPPSECVLPPHQRRGVHTTHSPGGEGVGCQYFGRSLAHYKSFNTLL